MNHGKATQVTSAVVCHQPGLLYEVTGGQKIQFIKRTNGETVQLGTTNEELLIVLIDRLKFLDEQFPCKENKQAIIKMEESLMWLNERTDKRIAQGVETRNEPHEDLPHS